ncbi:head GIN domain-containing protein [Pontimicrobium sp. MEBiC01747]|jgi:hypothetical protein
MRTITSVLLLFITLTAFAQNPKEKKVGDFTTVKVFDLIHISLVKSNENKVIITGEDVDDVEIVNKNGTLKVRMRFDKIFNGSETFVAVHYTNLKVIDGNEGAIIVGNELIEQDEIELKAQEGAVLKIGLNVDKVSIKAITGGVVETRGKANSQSVLINTGGIYEGKAFETKNTEVKIRTGGEAEVNTTDVVDAKVTAGGDIYIYGNPNTVTKKTTLGGRIKRVD